ncbi:SDR family oxidoreductase [Chitinophaga pinensis]|uniref:Short-chain dehydrogenase/reductase SDR n=1 Tax=Chitinophaga pinensis (strain ATCC 43595 / DSM 2588 / LMG 13176 / NBRC 15968 / NCIMB 11800 / UQM 2034) TaxID=485918 RepID=A0A979G8J5_CHIPD|nr:SDR family oxidoreductase [Chitinophaga pinensis]ACU62642.1 short-chain dehydrogenase/reductase SDR [Chitinophaga pinensis DSM 2588]
MTHTMNENNNRPASDIQGKSVIITGGTTGIGRATAILMASRGANVLVVGEDPVHLKDTISSVNHEELEGSLTGLTADLATESGIDSLFSTADKQFDKLDILINNAALAWQGVQSGRYQDWQKVINTNLLGYIACTQQALERMKKHKDGHIVNVGSMSADVREKDSSVYVATKAGVQGFSESLRKEVNELGIKVSLIEPGAVGTDMQPVSVPDQQQKEEKLEMLTAEDIAAAVLYVVSQPKRCDVVDVKIRPHLQLI